MDVGHSLEEPPGTLRDPGVSAALEAAYRALGPDYVPRTHLLDSDGRARFVNRLIREASPYLRQHAHNPVDWHPWSAETLAAAAARDVPIFLSVGYATCHWCHVMEEESFDDEQVAALLNAHYLPVKLDREQRPDLDQIYITATQLQQGHAGWPNSIWLMPDGRPFHTGTYFPKPQFMAMLSGVAEAWSTRRADVERVADQLSSAVQRLGAPSGDGAQDPSLPPSVPGALSGMLAQMYNADEGGFSSGQQFPQESFLLWQLDQWRRTGDGAAMGVASHTLGAIAAGGLHDHAGGGFHRYTVDANWRTPHFEKMLYNQGQIARALIEGWEITADRAWARAAERCFAYLLRDMAAPDGRFYAAEDADSLDAEGRREEGAFYAWSPDEARAVLAGEADWAIATLGLDQPPTIESGAVPHLTPGAPLETARLDPVLERLRQAREGRPRPIRDDKIIAGWNGLVLRAFAEGAEAFARRDLAEAAARAGNALWDIHWNGAELARLADAGLREPGLLEDYAWLGLGFLALHDATGDLPWLQRAVTLADTAHALFADAGGRLRMAAEDGPLGPVYESQDGATPAGESAACELFARLSHRLPAPDAPLVHAGRARAVVSALVPTLTQMPLVRPDMIAAARLLEEGESGYRRTIAEGAVRLALSRQPAEPHRWHLALRIAEGWHVTAAAGEGVVGPQLIGATAIWPVARRLAPAFAAGSEISVHEGTVTLDLAPDPAACEIALTLQVCADTLCLAPVTTRFRIA